MPKIKYKRINLGADKLDIIEKANAIITEYQAQGFELTLRQLYYQFVARDYIPNKQSEYKRLGDIINDARLAGLVDWLAIIDRTRNLQSLSHWRDESSIVRAVSEQFQMDLWADQTYRPEVWIEKDALVGVIEDVCQEFDVPYFSCRGYTSQSELWAGAMRLLKHRKNGQTPIILHFGDHDPSGIDMTRDITDRLELFMGGMEVRRLALNMNQVEQYHPPPNPAKLTDSRVGAYLREFGSDSWELDALEPAVIAGLIRNEIESLINDNEWNAAKERQQQGRDELGQIADRYTDVIDYLKE